MKHIKNIINTLLGKGVKIALSADQIQIKLTGNISNLSIEDKKELKLYKQELISTLKVSNKSLNSQENKIKKVDFQVDYPISDAQRRLWITSQFKDGSSAYNIPTKVPLKGKYDFISLEKAIVSVLERHEILRTVFTQNETGEIRQRILDVKDLNFKLKCNDLSNKSNKMELLDEYIKEDAIKIFDLEKGPLFRTVLFQLDESEYVFYYNMHHIISDGWSADVLGNDIMNYYEAYKSNTLPEIKDLSFQYKDYVGWQLEEMNKSTFDKDRQYWLDYLSGDLPLIDFPRYKNRLNTKTYNGGSLGTFLDSDTSKLIDAYVEKNGGSTFMFLLSVFNILTYFNTSSKDITIGTPVAGRDHLELKDQIGFYINTVAVRNKINTKENFNSFYNDVKTNILNCLEHQNYPFDRLIEDLEVKRSKSRNPIFDVFFVYQNDSNISNVDTIEGIDQIMDYGDKSSKFDLQLNFQKVGEYISFETVFNSDVYEKEVIKNLMSDFRCLIKEIINKSNLEISKLDSIGKENKIQLVSDFNKTKCEFSKDKLYLDLFQDQVKNAPKSLAVIFEEKSLSYEELDIKSNQLAHYLKTNYSIKSNELIGLKIDRSEWLIVSMLAVLKLGCAYVPLDLRYPKERESFIIKDTTLEIIIEDELLKDFKHNISSCSTENLNQKIKGDDLAYVIYTSGSTGTPKGVMITHYNLLSFIQNFSIDFNFSNVTKFGATTNFTFDISVIELLGVLSQGITIDLFSSSLLIDPEKVADRIVSENIDGIQFTPSRYSQLTSVSKDFLEKIEVVLVGGEALNEELFNTLKEVNGTVIQVYGPTETTIWSTSSLIDKDSELTIGKPLKNESVCILNEDLQLIPIGVVGEICIGGAGVAKGYLNRSELTKEKFIDNPYISGRRLYRTGDMGRWLPDGNIEFIGRKDNQVKIRGHRIELGEIEYFLLQNNEISQAVVLTIDDKDGETNLIAYLICESDQNINDLRGYLSAKMPHYMIPSHFVQVEEIPLTLSGKIDRKALFNNSGIELSTSQNYIAPKTKDEIQIVKIWEKILQRDTIGLEDDFFELGGHSLKALKLLNEYERSFKVKLSITDIFEKSRIIEQLRIIDSTEKKDNIEISKVKESESYAVSDGQMRLWLESLFEKEKSSNSSYNLFGVIPLFENLNIELFKKAIYATLARHEILRTVFKENKNGELRQYIQSLEQFNFKIDSLDYRNVDNKIESVQKYINEESYKFFDLELGPLLKLSLLRIDDKEYRFYYNIHHIICDAWSLDVLTKDILQYYQSFVDNKTPNLDELKIQYKDYSSWQIGLFNTEKFKNSKEFWNDKLKGNIPRIDLPSLKKRPAIKTNKGQGLLTFLDEETTFKLKRFSKKEGSSNFIVLLSIWNILIYRYTEISDMVIGTPVSGRLHSDLENQIGFYVNSIILRNKVLENDNFIDFHKRLKESTLISYSHQDYSFDRIVKELGLNPDLSRNPIYDIMFNVINNDYGKSEVNIDQDLFEDVKDLGDRFSRFDMSVIFKEVNNCLSFEITFNKDVYDSEIIERLMIHFKNLSNSLVEDCHENISNIDFISNKERKQILYEFNDVKCNYSITESAIELFEKQCVINRDEVALVYEGLEMTYEELNEKSNQLAHYIVDKYDIDKGDFIGLKLERNEWMIISVLAVLKVRGVYVPIDLEYPEKRISYIQKDTNFKLCIDKQEIKKFKNEEYSKENLNFEYSSQDLIYLIYTSGSTGFPKGVMVQNNSLINYIKHQSKEFCISNEDRILFLANYIFDASVEQFFLTLLNGAKLIIVPKDIIISDNISQFIKEKKISHLHTTPSYLAQLNNLEECKSLKRIVSGGEICPVKLVEKIPSNIEFYNKYGPTEATISSLEYKYIKRADNLIPIGKPISNTKVYILNGYNKLNPVGVKGEICISGKGLSQGYLNNSELTKQKFIANPFIKGEYMYKTGDIAFWLEDGNIEFVGRRDNQVKIRGHRIELDEINSCVLGNANINQSVTLVNENDDGDKKLIVYYTSKVNFENNELSSFLSENLPSYMVPNSLISIEKMPLNLNGKIDRKQLLERYGSSSKMKNTLTSPRNSIEEKMVEIWEEVLKTEKIGIEDDFFQLGGHSLKVILLLNKYHKAFEVKMPTTSIFEFSTIAEQSNLIESLRKEKFLHIDRLEEKESYSLSAGQRRLWTLSKTNSALGIYNIPHSIRIEGEVDVISFEKAIYSVLERHEILRTVFIEDHEEDVKQVVRDVFDINFKIVRKDFRHNNELANLYIKQDSFMPFDLEKGPLFRVALLQVEDDSYVFYYNTHHIISDGWSREVLSKDFSKYYESYKNDLEPSFNELPIQYKDYASWQLEQLETDASKISKDFWLDKLSGKLPILDLPTSKNRPVIQTDVGCRLTACLDKDVTSFIKEYSQVNGGSLFTGLLAVLNVLLYRYTSERDVIIGTAVAGRDHIDLKDQIGFYVNTLALRNQIDPEETFNSFYTRLKANTLAAYNHQMYPFDRLVEDLDLYRDTSRSVLFDIMLVLQNTGENTIDINLSKEELDSLRYTEKVVSKFDLEFSFKEIGDYLSFNVVYNSDVYNKDIISQFIRHFKQLLKSLQNNCDVTIGEIDYLSLEEKHDLLEVFNTTGVTYPKDKTIVDLFSDQVKSNPDSISIEFEGTKVTYKELDERSNRLAWYLREIGINEEDLVGLIIENPIEMIISILGVLKSGGAYVPIESNLPKDRIRYVLNDSELKFLISSDNKLNFKDEFKDEFKDVEFICLEEQREIINEKPALLAVPNNILLNRLFYVIYTSGSTGNPKGVKVLHKNLMDYFFGFKNEMKIKNSYHYGLMSTTSADLGNTVLFTSLLTGGTLHVFSKDTLRNPFLLHEYFHNNAIDYIKIVPSHWSSLENASGVLLPKRGIIFGGSVLKTSLVKKIKKATNDIQIINHYGPTETTIGKLMYNVDINKKYDSIPIGKIFSETNIYILDNYKELVPKGITGELYIGGEGVASGYLNRPELTKEKFIVSPFDKNERLYGTGDFVRMLPDNNLEFIGRKDDQVKINGHRIELGEVESVLLENKKLLEVIVLAKENIEGLMEMITYFTSSEEVSVKELISYLKLKLPEYMIPSSFVRMNELPLTPNGKIDRKKLLNIENQELKTEKDYVAPRNDIEEKLVAIWEEVLKREKIGIGDNFFELGGNSIKGIKIISKLQKEFNVKINFGALFKTPTIENLSSEVSQILSLREQSESREIVDSTII